MALHKTDPINPKKTLFLSNIDPSITAEELKKHFSSFGPINPIKFIQSTCNTTDSVNSAYINFLNPQHAALAKEESQYFLLGKKNIRICFQKDEKDFLLETVLFIENLPPGCTPEVLKRHFTDCGAPVSDVRVDNSREGQILGRGYALFKTIAFSKTALMKIKDKLEGKKLKVTYLGSSSEVNHFDVNTSIYITIGHQKNQKLAEIKDFLTETLREYGKLKKKLMIHQRPGQPNQVIAVFNEQDDAEAALCDLKRNPEKCSSSKSRLLIKDVGWYQENSIPSKAQNRVNEHISWVRKDEGSGEARSANFNRDENDCSKILGNLASQDLHKVGSKKISQKEVLKISLNRKEPQKGNYGISEAGTEEEFKDKDNAEEQKDSSNSIYTSAKPIGMDQSSSEDSQLISSLTITSEASNSLYRRSNNLCSISTLTVGLGNTEEENDPGRLDSSKLKRLETKNGEEQIMKLRGKETEIKESKQCNKKVSDNEKARKINQKNKISISQLYKKRGTRKKRRKGSKAEVRLVYHLKGDKKQIALDRSIQAFQRFNKKKRELILKESLFEVARKAVSSKLALKVAEMLFDSVKYKYREIKKLIKNKEYSRVRCREMINIIKSKAISFEKKTREWNYKRQKQQEIVWVVKQNFDRIMGIKLTEFLRFDALVRSQHLENFLLPIVSRLTNNNVAPKIVKMLIHISEKAQRELINIVENNNYLQKKVQRLYKFLQSNKNKESRSLYFQIESCQQETKQKKQKNRTRNAMNKQHNNMDDYLAYIVNCNMAYFMYNQMVMQSMRMCNPFGYQIGYQNMAGYQHINREIVESKPMVIENQLVEEKVGNVQKVEKIPKVEEELNKLKEVDRKEDQVKLNLSVLKESLENRVIKHFKRKLSTLNGYKPDKKESVLAKPLLPCIISLTDKKLGLEVFKKFKEKHVLKSVEGVMDLLDDPCLLKDQIEAIKKEFKG